MEKKENKMHLPTLDDLFTTQEERDSERLEKVVEISIKDIDDFPKHPFKVLVNDEMQSLIESVKEKGVIDPVIVRKKQDGRYEMISGHRRKKASEILKIDTIPCLVRDLTDDEATIIMVDSNLQREKILPSEKAFAYKLKLDAIKHQGERNDLTSAPMEQKLDARDVVAKEVKESREQVRRYIRLTELIPKFLEMVDNECLKQSPSMAFRPAVEISYLTKEEQNDLLDIMECYDCTPSLSQAIRLKKLSQDGKLTIDDMEECMKIEEIFTFENLYDSHVKCRKSKQQKGEVIRFEIDLSENIYKLMKELHSKKYKVGKYKQFIIYEPKKRLIEALPYRDRVVLMCFCEHSIIPRLDKRLIYDSVACRKNKGTLFGMDRLAYFLKKEYFKENNNKVYYLKCDIRKYFPSINHNILISNLRKTGFSDDEMWFLEKIIKEQPNNNDKGLPLGNQSSQWFALFYLNRIDRLIKEELKIMLDIWMILF